MEELHVRRAIALPRKVEQARGDVHADDAPRSQCGEAAGQMSFPTGQIAHVEAHNGTHDLQEMSERHRWHRIGIAIPKEVSRVILSDVIIDGVYHPGLLFVSKFGQWIAACKPRGGFAKKAI
jgi:hypothetical protein